MDVTQGAPADAQQVTPNRRHRCEGSVSCQQLGRYWALNPNRRVQKHDGSGRHAAAGSLKCMHAYP